MPGDHPLMAHDQRIEEAVGGLFVIALEELRTQAALLSGHGHQLLIIIRNVQRLGHLLADLSAAAAEFTANGDVKVTHLIHAPFSTVCVK